MLIVLHHQDALSSEKKSLTHMLLLDSMIFGTGSWRQRHNLKVIAQNWELGILEL